MAAIDEITSLYVGYFNRAPDPAGLNFWVAQRTAGASLEGIANSFSLVPEAQNLYGFLSAPLVGNAASFLSSVYLNLFGRVANATTDPTGFTYWQNQLTAPGAVVGRIIVDIISGAQGNDALVVANKSAVGKAFAQNILDNNAVFSSTLAANAFVGVTADSATATTAIATNLTAILATAGNSGGQTFTLTAGTDNFLGTSANDTFNAGLDDNTAANNTLSVLDTINGGGGSADILNVAIDASGATVAFPGANITGVEIFNLRNISGQTVTFDSALVAGDTAVNSDRSSDIVTITNLATGASAGMIGNGVVTNGGLNIGYATATDAAVLNISGGTKAGAIAYTSTPTSVTINSTTASNTVGTLNLGAAAAALTINAATSLTTGAITAGALKTITATGAAASVNVGTAPATVTTIDASGLTAGGITTGLVAAVTSFKGGQGNDVVTTAALTSTTASIINAGAGTADRVVINAATDVDSAAKGAQYAGFEVLQSTGQSVNLALFTNSTITSLRVAGTATFSGMNATQAGAVTVIANATPTFTITGATGIGVIDTLALTVDDGVPGVGAVGAITLGNINAAGVEIVNITANDGVTISSLTGLGALTNSTITGAGEVNIATGALAINVNTVINASALTGVFTFNATGATANGLAITGSATKTNTLTGTEQSDALTGGAANDTFTAGIQVTGQNNTVTGGAGGDLYVATAGENTTFKFAGTDSITTTGVTNGFLATAMDTIGSGTTAVVNANFADRTAGFKATIDTDVSATAVTFSTTAVTFGTTTVTNAGDFYVYDTAAGGVVFIYQDSNSNSKIDAGDFGVQLVGNASAFTSAEFTVAGGNLVFTSIV